MTLQAGAAEFRQCKRFPSGSLGASSKSLRRVRQRAMQRAHLRRTCRLLTHCPPRHATGRWRKPLEGEEKRGRVIRYKSLRFSSHRVSSPRSPPPLFYDHRKAYDRPVCLEIDSSRPTPEPRKKSRSGRGREIGGRRKSSITTAREGRVGA